MNFNALVDCFFYLYLLRSLYKEHEKIGDVITMVNVGSAANTIK